MIKLAHSPDADDAYMFYGIAAGAVKLPAPYVEFLADIETLNKLAMPNYKLLLVLAVALVAFASATNTNTTSFDLWLKCKAIELYLNVTGANATIPCDTQFSRRRSPWHTPPRLLSHS